MYNAAATVNSRCASPVRAEWTWKGAPFHYIGMEEKVCKVGDLNRCWRIMRSLQLACIRYCFWIKSSDGQRFKVGCDCVR